MYGTIRHEIRIERPAAHVWELAGDPTRLHHWFPGIVDCTVDGTTRIIDGQTITVDGGRGVVRLGGNATHATASRNATA